MKNEPGFTGRNEVNEQRCKTCGEWTLPVRHVCPGPAPVVSSVIVASREAMTDEIPTTAKRLAAAAVAAGWSVWTTYAQGRTSTTLHPDLVVDSVAVRLRKPGRAHITALWANDKFVSAVTSDQRRLNSLQMKAEVAA